MNSYEFFQFLKKWDASNRFPPNSAWPQSVALGREVWDKINTISRYTFADGYEYESTIFFVDHKVYATKPKKGTRDNVVSSHSIQVKYTPAVTKDYFDRNITADGNLIEKQTFYYTKIPKNTELGILFNVHSHPKYNDPSGKITYSFFSGTDIRSFMVSKSTVMCLITDRLWLIGKTDKVDSSFNNLDEITRMTSYSNFSVEKVKEEYTKMGFVLYSAVVNSNLIKL